MSGEDPMKLTSAAQGALDIAAPSVLQAIQWSTKNNRNALHVVILDPRTPYTEGGETPILCERTFGEQNNSLWVRDFKAIARSKARVCWRTGLSCRTVGEKAPYLYNVGDTKYPGGIVCDGLIVATSGLDWQMDEACAHMVIAFFWAQVRMTRDGLMATAEPAFL